MHLGSFTHAVKPRGPAATHRIPCPSPGRRVGTTATGYKLSRVGLQAAHALADPSSAPVPDPEASDCHIKWTCWKSKWEAVEPRLSVPGSLCIMCSPRGTSRMPAPPARAFAVVSSASMHLPLKNAVVALLGQVRWHLLMVLPGSCPCPLLDSCLAAFFQPPPPPLCRSLGDILWPRTGTKHWLRGGSVGLGSAVPAFRALKEPCTRTALDRPQVTHANTAGASLSTRVL